MMISSQIDLGKSLRQVFGNSPESTAQVESDRRRQVATVDGILERFFEKSESKRREFTILADEVGLGKTYVALAAAVSILDSIRNGIIPDDIPSTRPVVLVLTPNSDALFNKWMREAEAFKKDCAKTDGDLDWLQIRSPLKKGETSEDMADLAEQVRTATRSKPMLLISKCRVLGNKLKDRDRWRSRALLTVFRHFRMPSSKRRYWCHKGRLFDNLGVSDFPELIDFRKSQPLWSDWPSPKLAADYRKALSGSPKLQAQFAKSIASKDFDAMKKLLGSLTRRALARQIPGLSLVIIDEIHNLKNEEVQTRQHLSALLTGRVYRLLGLSATPFQLRQDELMSLLKLRQILHLQPDRQATVDTAIDQLAEAMKSSREGGDLFRRRWRALRHRDATAVLESWQAIASMPPADQKHFATQIRPPRIAHAIDAALELELSNQRLQCLLRPFVIRHQHPRGYREHFVGQHADVGQGSGTLHFSWAPGIEVKGRDELAQYLMMRSVALSKDEKGLPGLGAEMTGSYRHLVETAAVWKKMAKASNPLLREYRALLENMIALPDADDEHHKVQTTVRRALEFFKRGQKSLVFCVYTKTAETIRDQIQSAIEKYLGEVKRKVFGGGTSFENFRRRFFNRREPLYSLIQDHPLLSADGGVRRVPIELQLGEPELRRIAQTLTDHGEPSNHPKPDRRLLLAATEHVAIHTWADTARGEEWLESLVARWQDGKGEWQLPMASAEWMEAREPLSRSKHAGRTRRVIDPEAMSDIDDPLDVEHQVESSTQIPGNRSRDRDIEQWIRRLREDAIGEVVSPYFCDGIIANSSQRLPLLVEHHAALLQELDLPTRAMAGQVFRRILMAEEFLLRYVTDVQREDSERWANHLAERYVRQDGHFEPLRDRVHAYLETLVRSRQNSAMLAGYHAAAENQNVVQLVKGETKDRDRYFLGFNTPYRPEILISTSVGQEGIDLHRECRHVIHHDLCWNPATIEQRTGRVDRIGSKVERERLVADGSVSATLEIAVPYLAATYDERMFEELYRRAQLFEVTLGGDMRVEGRIDPEVIRSVKKLREKAGIGTEDEDLGQDTDDNGTVDLPKDMVERLRVDLAVWKSPDSTSEALV